jgi:hypothetical protein
MMLRAILMSDSSHEATIFTLSIRWALPGQQSDEACALKSVRGNSLGIFYSGRQLNAYYQNIDG